MSKRLFITFIVCLIGMAARAGTLEERNPLRPGEVVKSPDRNFQCWTEALSEGGVVLWLQGVGEKKVLIRSSLRSVGVCWSPDSRWLAVSDNYMAAEAAILIYDCSQATRPLVYQTPLSTTDQDIWAVVRWNVAKKEVVLSRSRRFSSGADMETVVVLTDKPINPAY